RAAGLDAIVLEFHLHGADDARLLRAAGVPVAYSLPRPTVFAKHDAYGGDDLARLAATLLSDAVSLLIGDDVGWIIDQAHARGIAPMAAAGASERHPARLPRPTPRV